LWTRSDGRFRCRRKDRPELHEKKVLSVTEGRQDMSSTARLQALVSIMRRLSERMDRSGKTTEVLSKEMALAVGELIVSRFPEQRSFVLGIDLRQLAKSVLKKPTRAARGYCRICQGRKGACEACRPTLPTPPPLSRAEYAEHARQTAIREREREADEEKLRRLRALNREILVVLVGCGASKADKAMPAKYLYTGSLFRSAYAAAERVADDFMIISAGHGLLSPDAVTEPYERDLSKDRLRDREAWGWRVGSSIASRYLGMKVRIIALAGSTYTDVLRFPLSLRGIRLETPLDGLGLGERLRELKSWRP